MINVHASLLPAIAARRRFTARSSPASARPASRSCGSSRRSTPAPMLATARRADRPGRDERRRRARSRASSAPRLLVADRSTRSRRARPRRRPGRTLRDLRAATDEGRRRRSTGPAGARHIHNLMRGLHPWPHAFTSLDGARLILLRSLVRRPTAVAAAAPSRDESLAHRPRRRSSSSRPATGRCSTRSSCRPKGDAPMTRASSWPGTAIAPGARFGRHDHDRAGAPRRVRQRCAPSRRAAPTFPTRSRAARERLADERDRALAAESPPARCAGRARSITSSRRSRKRPVSTARPRGPRHPAPRASINCSTSTACPASRRRGRCRGPDAGGAARRAPPASSTRCCGASPRARTALPLPGAAGRPATRAAHSTTFASRCRTRAGSPRAGSTASGFERAEAWMRFNNAPAPLTLRANRLRTTRERRWRTRSPRDGVERRRRPRSRPTA